MTVILDNNALIYLEAKRKYLPRYLSCFITEDIRAEFLIGKKEEAYLSRCSFIYPVIYLPTYLTEYKRVLNKYAFLSFFNMKGAGDLSILATACALSKGGPHTMTLFVDITVVTNDMRLTRALVKEFPSGPVTVIKVEDWVKSL